MAYSDRPSGKRVTFEEPLFINIEETEKLEYERPRPRARKLVLWMIAAFFLFILAGGSHVKRCSQHVTNHVHKHMKQKYNHTAEQVTIDAKKERSKREEASPAAEVCSSGICKAWADSIRSNLAPNRTAIDPCEDFSTYVCGGWRETHDYRADQASISVGSIMGDVNKDLLHSILEGEYPEGNSTFTGEAKAIDKENFAKMKIAYNTCKDVDAINSYGVAPVQKLLDELEQYYKATGPKPANNEELTNVIIWLAKNSVSALVSYGVSIRFNPKTDDKNPDTKMIGLGGGSYGLSSKQYYKNAGVIANYTRATAQMFQIIQTGKPIANESLFQNASAQYTDIVTKIVDLEKKLAFASPDPDKAQEITISFGSAYPAFYEVKNTSYSDGNGASMISGMPKFNAPYFYKPTTLAAMDKLVPEFSFTAALKASVPAGYEVKSVLNSDSQYFEQISKIIQETPREVLHAHFQARLISAWAGRLGKEYRRPLSIFGNLMAGRDPWSESERWRSCLSEVDGSLGWILSAAFIERAFSANAKSLGDRIVKDIKAVFTERLKTFDWMSASTKAVAEKKVNNIAQKIGYPTASPNIVDPKDLKKWYANLTVSNNYFENGRALAKYGREKSWRELPLPVDRARWSMTAPTVNAYYNPSGNEIVFPAGIMQLPVFGEGLPEYVSYGAFGAVAGHELTHGFDNNGAHYDENGKYADWWDNTTTVNFDKKTECFVDQYAKFTIPGLDGEPLHVNGRLTLGENIADAGGLTAAFTAWKKRDTATPNPSMPGLEEFSKEQLFFMSYSNWWCGKVRPAQAVQYVYQDPHSPADKRILGTLANSAAFKEAFKCKSRQPTCELW